MSRGQVVYTLHLWPPLGHAGHYTGTTPERRLERRLADHALGRGARLTQVQIERGGWWVLAQTQPGGRSLERRLKQHSAARRCEVCKAVGAYRAGDLPAADALARAGWGRSSPAQRSLLLDIFGLPEPPGAMAAATASGRRRRSRRLDASVPAPRPTPPPSRGRGRPPRPTRRWRPRWRSWSGAERTRSPPPAAAGTRPGGGPVNPARSDQGNPTRTGGTPAMTSTDPSQLPGQPSDPAMFAPLTTDENSILRRPPDFGLAQAARRLPAAGRAVAGNRRAPATTCTMRTCRPGGRAARPSAELAEPEAGA